ncbi:MAG: stage III sporulation protein AB [Lachnospiraceae bacterium]|nr:stage III sporulation protein AB [Lachnospiraceae bacterium]
MVKLIACVCFLTGCTGYGLIKATEYKKRYNEMIYIKYILQTMLIDMEHHRGTFGETCLAVSEGLRQPYQKIFYELYQLLECERIERPEVYWGQCMDKLAKELLLNKEETGILQQVIKCVNGTTVNMPLENMKQCLDEWDKAIQKAERVRNEKSRVTIYLSITAGLLLCITII